MDNVERFYYEYDSFELDNSENFKGTDWKN